MTDSTQQGEMSKAVGNLKVLGLAGAGLFFLGLAGVFLVFFRSPDGNSAKMALSAAFLVAMGYPALLYVRLGSALLELDKRVRTLEQPPSPSRRA